MKEIVKELLRHLNSGRQAALVSQYGEKGIVRSLVCEDEPRAWRALEDETEGDAVAGLTLIRKGETMTLVERFTPKPRLLVLGGGHIAQPVCHLGARLGFEVTVYDDRPSFANSLRFPEADEVICDSFENVQNRLGFRERDYVVIVTRGHRHDSLCLRGLLLGTWPRYVGMIGSRRRVAIVKQQLAAETGAANRLEQLHAPIGLPIGAVTPEEIGLSILAEMVQAKRLGTASSARETYPDMELMEWLGRERSEAAALITIVAAKGSTPREVGAKMAVTALGQTVGSIGGGCAESEVIQRARRVLRDKGYCLMEVDMTDTAEEDGMVCGGTMQVLIEAAEPAE